MKRIPSPSHPAVRAAIATLLRHGDTGLPHAARKLRVSPRSLQRHLADIGTSYSQLLDDVRRDKACQLLAETNERLCDIAARLGFADPGSFSRSFVRLMKTQPRAYRRQRMAKVELNRPNRKRRGD